MNILQREKPKPDQKPQEEPQPLAPECVDTKLIVWQGDQFQEFEVDFLNQVYPEKINKDTVSKGCQFIFHFLSASLYYWVQIKDGEAVEEGKLSSKDWKFIQSTLAEQGCDNSQNYNRWGQSFMKKQQFHKKQSEQPKFQPPKGQPIHSYTRGTDKFTVHHYQGNNKEFIPFKQRFEILFLLYIDGVSFVDEESEEWEYYVVFREKGDGQLSFVAVLSKYIFRLTSVKERHRVSQVFVMPAYQKMGHGKQLLDLVYTRALSLQTCFQITTQIPSFEYQCLRDYKQLELILQNTLLSPSSIPPITNKASLESAQQHLLTKQTLRKLKEQVKLPGNQIQRLVHLLIYARVLAQDESEIARAHFQEFVRQRIVFNRSAFKSRKKVPHITFQGEAADMKEFFLEKAKQDYVRNQEEIQQVLTETLDGFRRVITKLTKNGLLNFAPSA